MSLLSTSACKRRGSFCPGETALASCDIKEGRGIRFSIETLFVDLALTFKLAGFFTEDLRAGVFVLLVDLFFFAEAAMSASNLSASNEVWLFPKRGFSAAPAAKKSVRRYV